jgi:pumilio family protein 6
VEPRLRFPDVLYQRIQPYIVEWATSPSSFVVIALMEAADFASKDELLAKLGKKRELLEEVASENKGAALLLSKLH